MVFIIERHVSWCEFFQSSHNMISALSVKGGPRPVLDCKPNHRPEHGRQLNEFLISFIYSDKQRFKHKKRTCDVAL